MCHTPSCPFAGKSCNRGTKCEGDWSKAGCNMVCAPPIKHRKHQFSQHIESFIDENRPHWVRSVGGWVKTDSGGWEQADWVRTASPLMDAPRVKSSPWLDDDTIDSPLTRFERILVLMLRSGISLAQEGAKDVPQFEKDQFDLTNNFSFSGSSKVKDLSFKLPRDISAPRTLAGLGTTPVTDKAKIPGVRVWVTNANEILASTGMEAEWKPDDPDSYQQRMGEKAVYIRFRNDGKLKNAGAGYFLAPSLSHLITSVYNGLAFKAQEQHHFLDVGVSHGERTCLTKPYCYPASLSPGIETHTCKKGNIYAWVQTHVSFRLGDVGVGHPDWVEATKDDGGMNARSQGGGPGYNRTLLIMAELLTTHVLRVINNMA